MPANATEPAPDATPYRQALAAFQRHDYERALRLTEPVPDQGGSGERACVLDFTPVTLTVVQLLPENATADPKDRVASTSEESNVTGAPSFRYGVPPAPAEGLTAADLPPANVGVLPDQASRAATGTNGTTVSAHALAKPRHSRSTPAPAPTATPAPTEAPDTQSGTAAATPTPAPSASPATPASDANPAESPSPEFIKKYEAAYVAFLKKDYPATISLLNEADKIQPKQSQSITLRKQVFKQEYEAAYFAFRKADYPAALTQLDAADLAQLNYPDALNLRGLVYSKQHAYDQAETMFKKAVEADPTLWAAKFNYAELPFNRGDYTTARSRFEDLLGETDNGKLPREYELTQYKVFLTLLLEGKTDQARSFMDHFNFSGATPAKYFCNAAMNFRAGSTEKANGWINSAKREYPAQLVTIFIESFYRLGWMSDPNASALGTAVADASPAASPGVEAVAPGVTPTASGTPSASPALAAVSPGKVDLAASPVTAPSVLLAASASPSTKGVPLTADAAPLSAATPASAPSANSTPAASPLAAASDSPMPASTANPIPATSGASAATRAPESTPAAADDKGFTADDALRLVIGAGVLLYGLYVLSRLLTSATRRKARRGRAGGPVAAAVNQPENEPAKSETPR